MKLKNDSTLIDDHRRRDEEVIPSMTVGFSVKKQHLIFLRVLLHVASVVTESA